MSDSIPPLDPGLASLFERESRAYSVDARIKEKVLRGVSRSVLLAMPAPGSPSGSATPGTGPAGPGPGAGLGAPAVSHGKLAALLVLAFLGGGVTGAAVVGRGGAPVQVTAQPTSTTVPPVAKVSTRADWTPVTQGTSSAAPPVVSSNSLPIAPATPSGAARPASSSLDRGPGTLTREREVLDAARAALSHGQLGEALAALHDHETRWPHGSLEEEREAMTIQALAAAGRTTAAEERAARFRRAFPSSMLIEVVNAALARAGAGASP